MKPTCLFILTLSLGLSAGGRPTLAQQSPRQLGGAPVPTAPTATPATVVPPRQLEARPRLQPALNPAARPVTTATVAPASGPSPLVTPPPAAGPAPTPGAGLSHQPYPGPGQLMGGFGQPTRYRVGLKTGTVLEAREVAVKSPLFGHEFLLLDGQRRFDLAEVGFYETEAGYFVRAAVSGSADELTLRRETTGRLSLYAAYGTTYTTGLAGPDNFGSGGFGPGNAPNRVGAVRGGYGLLGPGAGGRPANFYRTTKTEYFARDNGPIQRLNTRTLLLATTDNPGAQALLTDARRYQTVATVACVVGGGLLVAGLVRSLSAANRGSGGSGSSSGSLSPVLFVALPVLAVPLLLQGKQGRAQRLAIARYNEEK